MAETVLLDTGPLVAWLNRRDGAHAECLAAAESLEAPLLTCWPVLTEAAWLLRSKPDAVLQVQRLVEARAIQVVALEPAALPWIAEFMDRYRDFPAQLADAALMYLAEQLEIQRVFTLDRRHFAVYRLRDGQTVGIVP